MKPTLEERAHEVTQIDVRIVFGRCGGVLARCRSNWSRNRALGFRQFAPLESQRRHGWDAHGRGFQVLEPQDAQLAVPAAAFIHESSTAGGQVTINAPQVAPVSLPDGATVKKVQWYYDVTASNDDALQLEVWDPAPGAESNMVSIGQSPCNGLPCVSSTTGISSPVINNKTHHYVLMLFPGPMEPVTTFKIVITYEVTVPD